MRAFLLLSLCLAVVSGVAALPRGTSDAACPSLPVTLELRPMSEPRVYQLVFVSHEDTIKPDYVDIHYRVNNDDAVNLRVLSQMTVQDTNLRARQAQVDGIILHPGDALRAFATYSSRGYECDTAIHTFSAPEEEMDRLSSASIDRDRSPVMHVTLADGTEHFMTQAAIEEHNAQIDNVQAILSEASPDAACPAIDSVEEIFRQKGLADTYVLSFENKNPAKQLHYVDLHVSNEANDQQWDNLRLASDMQLTLAHKVMQPGIVMHPQEALRFYWSYRTDGVDGTAVDCTTPIRTITASQVTHEVDLEQLRAAATPRRRR